MKVLIIGATGSTGRILLRKGDGARSPSDGLSSQPLCRCTSRLPSSRAGRQRAGSRGGGGCRGGTGRCALGAGHPQHEAHDPGIPWPINTGFPSGSPQVA